jgi:hypothetical protein
VFLGATTQPVGWGAEAVAKEGEEEGFVSATTSPQFRSSVCRWRRSDDRAPHSGDGLESTR